MITINHKGNFGKGKNPWEITERLSHTDLQAKLNYFNDKYAGQLTKHVKSQGCYRIDNFSVMNVNGTAEYAVNYHPYDESTKRDYDKVKHTRPAREFFDGRFI